MKRKKKEEEHIDEAWLLPYADMLTLLLALFIVMFGMAKMDEGKFQEFKKEFGTIFSGLNSNGDSIVGSVVDLGNFEADLDGGSTVLDGKNITTGEGGEENDGERTVEGEVQKEVAMSQKLEDQQIVEAGSSLQKELQSSALGKDVNVSMKSDGLHIALDSNILFGPGSTELSASAKKTLRLLGPSFKKLSQEITIAGYTDNVPETGKYGSNWELSSQRALSVMNFLVEEKFIPASSASIQAYGENRPRATNTTEKGRAKNRRVEIIIQKAYR